MDTDASCHRWESKTFSAHPPERKPTPPAAGIQFYVMCLCVCDEIFAHLHKGDAEYVAQEAKDENAVKLRARMTKVNALTQQDSNKSD